MTLTPCEIFTHLGSEDPVTDRAWTGLDALLRRLAAQVLVRAPDIQDECVQELLERLVKLRDLGKLPVPESDSAIRGYLARALRNLHVDHVRAARKLDHVIPLDREDSTDRSIAADWLSAPTTMPSNPERDAEALFADLDGIFHLGLTLEPSADRDVRQLGWAQIRALALKPLDARGVLELTGQLHASATRSDFERARSSMYKTHERVRSQLMAGVELALRSGDITPDRAIELRNRIALLRRRQIRAPSSSS